mgnify:FL=1
MNIKETIKNRRRRLSMTQSELAKRAGVHQSCVSKVENGTTDPSIAVAVKIVSALGLELIITDRHDNK